MSLLIGHSVWVVSNNARGTTVTPMHGAPYREPPSDGFFARVVAVGLTSDGYGDPCWRILVQDDQHALHSVKHERVIVKSRPPVDLPYERPAPTALPGPGVRRS